MTAPGAAIARSVALALAAASGAAAGLTACSPTFDWRQARPAGTEVTMLFPCRPSQAERVVPLGDARLPMRLHSCAAGGAVFSLAVVEVGRADRAVALLATLRAGSAANLGGVATPWPAVAVPGAVSAPQGGRARFDGHLPDGRAVVEHALFFVDGTRACQAAIVAPGTAPASEVLDTFFEAVRLH